MADDHTVRLHLGTCFYGRLVRKVKSRLWRRRDKNNMNLGLEKLDEIKSNN